MASGRPLLPNRSTADDRLQRFEELIDRHRAPLLRYFSRKLPDTNREDLEDLVQDVFVRMARMEDIMRLENPQAFVFKVAGNILKDRQRREIVRASATRSLSDTQAELRSPERVLLAQQQLEEVRALIDSLPQKVRDAFLLSRLEGLSYNDIAEVLNVSVSSVEKYIMRALKVLASRSELHGD